MQRLFLLFALATLPCFAVLAGGQVTPGTPSFSAYDTDPSGYTTVNLQNLNVMMNVPVMSKSGAFPYVFGLQGANSYVYLNGSLLEPGYEVVTLLPTKNGADYGTGNTATTGVTCPAGDGTGTATKYGAWYVSENIGTRHYLPSTDVSYVGATCSAGFTDMTTDGSGVILSVTGATVNSVYLRDGSRVLNGTIIKQDSNGNAISVSGSSDVDTLGVRVLTYSSGTNTNTYSWTDVNGGTPQSTTTYTGYVLRSAFGCTGKTDYNTGSTNQIPTSISFPDGTSLGLAWEATPGFSSDRTGRIATVTMRDGSSTVSFNYNPNSAANDGLNCTYLVPNNLSRTTSDGTVTYAWAHTSTGNTTTKIDVGGNKFVYTFNSTPVLT